MLFGSSSDFASAWASGTGSSLDRIIAQANKLGFSYIGRRLSSLAFLCDRGLTAYRSIPTAACNYSPSSR